MIHVAVISNVISSQGRTLMLFRQIRMLLVQLIGRSGLAPQSCFAWSLATMAIAVSTSAFAPLNSVASAADTDGLVPSSIPGIHIHPDLQIEVVAGPPLVNRPVMACIDHRGRLWVVDSNGDNLPYEKLIEAPPHRLRMLEDTTGKGKFDKSTLFAEKLVMPQGVHADESGVYVASPPAVWRLRDTNGDNVADERTEIVTEFGSIGNAADVHGPVIGQDGWLYICDGRNGHRLKMQDGRLDSGKAAGIYRCRIDGSGLQRVIGGGMDNPVEIDFTPGGDLIGTVNLLHAYPRQDSLVHWIDGGRFPRDEQEQVLAELEYVGPLLEANHHYGHVAVSGMLRYRGDKLGSQFRDTVFVTQFNRHKLVCSRLQMTGSTYTATTTDVMACDNTDFHPTDVLQDADGSLLLLNTGGWFRIACPESQIAKPEVLGSILRISRKGSKPPAAFGKYDPHGNLLDWKSLADEEVAKLLADARTSVSQRAIDVLHRRGQAAADKLEATLAKTLAHQSVSTPGDPADDRDHKLAIISLLGRWATPSAQRTLITVCKNANPTLRLAAVNALSAGNPAPGSTGTLIDEVAVTLAGLLGDEDAAVSRGACTAIGRCVSTAGPFANCWDTETRGMLTSAISGMLRERTLDRYHEHAATWALLRLNSPEVLLTEHRTTVAAIRTVPASGLRASLIATAAVCSDTISNADVLDLIGTDHSTVRDEALRLAAERPEFAAALEEFVSRLLFQADVPPASLPVIRNVLAAREQDASYSNLIATALTCDASTGGYRSTAELRMMLWDLVRNAQREQLTAEYRAAATLAIQHGPTSDRLAALELLSGFRDFASLPAVQSAWKTGQLTKDERVAVASTGLILGEQADAEMFGECLAALNSNRDTGSALIAARGLSVAKLSVEQRFAVADVFPAAAPLSLPVLIRQFASGGDADMGARFVSRLASSPGLDNVSPEELAAILRRFPDEVAESAADILRRLGGETPSEQAARLKELAELIHGGNVSDGRNVFTSQQAACSGCHRVKENGGLVGPDLSTIGGTRSAGDLLEAIVYPSASFARDYRSSIVELKSGLTHTGVISRQSAEMIELRTADLRELKLPRREVEEIRDATVSIMPKGVERTLTPQQMRDLLAYLQSLK